MDKYIEKELKTFLEMPYFDNNSIVQFGENISNLVFKLPENEFKETINTIYNILLRKDYLLFYNANARDYNKVFTLNLYEGLEKGFSDKQNIAILHEKLEPLLLKTLSKEKEVIKFISVAFTSYKTIDESTSELAFELGRKIVYTTLNHNESGKYVPYHALSYTVPAKDNVVDFWTTVSKELTLTNRNEYLPLLKEKVAAYLPTHAALEKKPELIDFFINTLGEGLNPLNGKDYSLKDNDLSVKIGQIRNEANSIDIENKAVFKH